MEFIGQIIKVCEPRTGVSERTGNEWKAQGFIVEYKEHDTDPWHDKVYLETFDTNIMPQLVEGAIIKVGFRHNTREYNGRYYNEVRMNNFELQDAPMEARQPQNQPAGGANASGVADNGDPAVVGPQNGQNQAQEENSDDLPF